ncbi:hypothetical protein GTH52_05180 [Clostridium tyrobutyricum]|jgi:hypothetical protein|uniref:Uncharacterized protein n=1 Tax=Clostridium tyrobutyricum DIVETGP TaxID=1408889 RepID=W6N3R2_CLOTY|nr:hypothetical protein [Clostridium tyrobutyricum]AND84736.1 hypothetical protein CTK_C14750 [Clostridium tyrobutyricum]ANP69329.1 hypothetical protein BA182_06485 [Clostridium tyrobutyricum]MBV4435160.1 hypothetical protein [Clostridium tyrobutyricum]MBV4441349.1 hypothetical protein [Clostridium tyrobutyricum]MBV4450839.1 hypothetical protein [Clostridium tyrobutyricum]
MKKCEELKAIQEIYPETNLDDKIIFLIKSKMYFPFKYMHKEVYMSCFYEDELEDYPINSINPCLNKNVSVAGMKYGKKTCSIGIPLIFDNIDELDKFKSVSIRWKFKCKDNEGNSLYFYILILYDLNFIKVDGFNIYVLNSNDFPVNTGLNRKNTLENYISKFERIIFIDNKNNPGDFNIQYIKGIKSEDEVMIAMFYSFDVDWSDVDNFFKDALSGNPIYKKIYSYYSNLTLTPHKIGEYSKYIYKI